MSCNSRHVLSLDHSPIHLERDIKRNLNPPAHFHNSKTDWALFQDLLDHLIDIKLSLKTEDDVAKVVKHCVQKHCEALCQVSKMQLGLPLLNFAKTILHYIMFRQTYLT